MELVDELIEKRDRHNAEAERHKRFRDKLNDETRSWVARRDAAHAAPRAMTRWPTHVSER